MKRIWEFIGDHAYIFMLLGMIIGITGLLFLMKFDKTGGPKSDALVLGIIGIIIYLIGRISLFFKNKRKKSDT
jgi:hypothetical protein